MGPLSFLGSLWALCGHAGKASGIVGQDGHALWHSRIAPALTYLVATMTISDNKSRRETKKLVGIPAMGICTVNDFIILVSA